MSNKSIYFSSKREALMLPPCLPESKTPYAWYKHASEAGFYIRASKEKNGKFEKRYFHRYKVHVTEKDGEFKQKEVRDDLGSVTPGPKVDYDAALEKLLAKRRELKSDTGTSGSPRLTLAGAWAHYDTEKQVSKTATKEKYEELYERYFRHMSHRYLDELPYSFWAELIKQLREGTYVVGQKERKDGKGLEPILLGPLAPASLHGVINTVSLLYEIGNKFGGVHGELKGANPATEAKKLIGAPNEKSRHIPLKDLGTAVRAANQLVSPWWRDLFMVFVLTGLRRSLVFNMKFSEIDFERSLYIIHPLKRGAKRRARDVTPSTPMIRIPLSRYVLELIRARREFAPDKDGLVWFTPKPTRGRRVKDDKQSLSDPRTAWVLLEWAIGGLHFSPHDLRRTFSTAATVAEADVFGIGLLMLHSGEGLAKFIGVPGITIKYIDTDEAVGRARKAAEKVTEYVLKLTAMPPEEAAKIIDPVLPDVLEEALAEVD